MPKHRLDKDHELSDAAADSVRLFLAGSPPPSEAVGDEAIARFVTGLCTPEEREQIVAAMIASSLMRERLVRANAELKELANLPVGSLPAAGEDTYLRECLLTAFSESISLYRRLREWCIGAGWSAICSSDSFDALSARSAIESIGETLKIALATPRFAITRGSSNPIWMDDDIVAEIDVDFSIDLDQQGDLRAVGLFRERFDGAGLLLKDRVLYLELIDPAGGSIPIAKAPILGLTWEVRVPGFGQISKLSSSHVSAELFRLALETEMTREPGPSQLLAENVGKRGPIAFTVVEPPHVLDETLTIALSAPRFLRDQLAPGRLEFLMPAGGILQLLGTWPMRDWTEDVKVFRIPLSGVADGPVDCGSILRVRVHGSAE